jgi:hypothetical protein
MATFAGDAHDQRRSDFGDIEHELVPAYSDGVERDRVAVNARISEASSSRPAWTSRSPNANSGHIRPTEHWRPHGVS